MSLIYGYNDEKEDNSNNGNVSDLEKLVGKKTDDRTTDTAFGRIKDNKKNISNSIISTANVVASVVSSLGQKTDDKTVDSAFGKIKKKKKIFKLQTPSWDRRVAWRGNPLLRELSYLMLVR